jgi:hypothetical protein
VLKNPTRTEYDSLDRTIKTELPAEAQPGETPPTQTTRYAIRNGLTWTITTDPLGNISEQGADGRGNIVAVRRLDKTGTTELTKASYQYNGLGEMLKALDADGNPLRRR